MKSLIILFVAAFATFTVAEIVLKGEFKDASDHCIKSSGVEKDLVVRGRKNDFVEDEKLMHYYTCVFQKLSGQNADGSFKLDAMVEMIPKNFNQEDGAKAVKKCFKTEAGDPAKAAYDAVKCFISTMLTKA